jgi:hypothetical protein
MLMDIKLSAHFQKDGESSLGQTQWGVRGGGGGGRGMGGGEGGGGEGGGGGGRGEGSHGDLLAFLACPDIMA